MEPPDQLIKFHHYQVALCLLICLSRLISMSTSWSSAGSFKVELLSMWAVHVVAPLLFETSRWPVCHPPLRRGQTSIVSSCLIHVYMPNLVGPSVGPVWPNQSLDLAADFQSHPHLPRWLPKGLRTPTSKYAAWPRFLVFFPRTFARMFLMSRRISHLFYSSVRERR